MTKAGTNSLTWDENGSMTVGIGTTLAYNWDNKLRSATEGTKSISVKYDPDGNRIWKESTVSGQTDERKYIVDVIGDLPVILMEINPADSSIVKSYIHVNAQIFAKRDGGQAGTRYFYLHDRLGSVRQIINSSGSVVKYSTFEPFGESIESGGTFDDPFGFTGQYFDAEIGEYYLRARQYNPAIARFTARDPVFGRLEQPLTLHKYLYCGNDPSNLVDPEGMWYVDLNYSWSSGTGEGWAAGPLGALKGSMTVTAGTMFGTEEGYSTPGFYSYLGAGLTLSATGGHTWTLTGSLDDIARGWNFGVTIVGPTGHVVQGGWSGEISNPSTFFDDLKYGVFEWAEAGVRLGGGAKLPNNIPKYLKTLDPKWLLKNSTDPRSIFSSKDWVRNASVSVTGFYVWGWDVFSGDWTDRNFAAAEMLGNPSSDVGLLTRNSMLEQLLGSENQ